jgi:putative ABC transport system permease protein
LQTWQSAEARLQRFFDEMLRFLATLAVFILLLAGMSVQSTLSAFLNQRRTTLATLKALGATSSFITRHYAALVAAFGAVGLLVGIGGGLLVQFSLAAPMQRLVGPTLQVAWSPLSIGVAVACGVGVTAVFTRYPLAALQDVKPHHVFKFEPTPAVPRRLFSAANGVALVLGLGLLLYEVRSALATACIALVMALLFALQGVGCWIALRHLRTPRWRSLPWRHAVAGLFRPGNQSWLVAVNLATALTVLLTIVSVEGNLRNDLLLSYPSDSPNVFFIDIQKDQTKAFQQALGVPCELYPVVQARIASVNGKPVVHEDNPEYRKGNLDREVRLTYRDHLLDSERLVGADTLFGSQTDVAQVSLVRELADDAHLHVGDRLIFNIQGVDVPAVVSSIRELSREGIRPAFEFVVSPAALADAPATFFTAVHLPDVPAAQNRLAAAFPNVSSIDVHDAMLTLSQRLSELDTIVRFFTWLCLATGGLMLLGALLSTEAGRLQEVVYFKLLGARRSFVVTVVTLEGWLLGALASLLAVVEAQALTWGLCRYALDIDFVPNWTAAGVALVLLPAAVALLGLWGSRPLLQQKPAAYLRQQEDASG